MRNKLKYGFSLCVLLLVFPCLVLAQSNTESKPDFETWFAGQANYKVHPRIKLAFQQQFRFKTNSTVFDKSFSQLESDYKISKNFEVGAALRHTWENDNIGKIQGIENHIRYNFDFSHAFKKKRFRFKNRLRYQRGNELGVSELEGDYPASDFRLRSSIGYDFKKWKLDPTISCEWFYHKEIGKLNAFKFFTFATKTRFRLATDYKIDDQQKLNFFFLFEAGTDVWSPKRSAILGAKYVYTLKPKPKQETKI